ncbi:MAG TPA: hypothetical protein VFX59_09580, partial [Polyangiales bacterium]|nr:hypothetical protein [Polyangiales bacterium]
MTIKDTLDPGKRSAKKRTKGDLKLAPEPAPKSAKVPRSATMKNALGGTVPVTEWDRLSADSRTEIEHLVEVLKALKQGDFAVRFELTGGILARAGELL